MLRLVVPVKQVGSLDEDFELQDGVREVDPDYLDHDLNEWDAFSVEAALQIKEAHDDAEVVVITVGDDDAEEALLACLAKGADRAIRVWDADIPTEDPLAIARVLAAAIEAEQPDLILCGVQSSDAASSATGIALAGILGLPHTAVARALDYDAAAKRVNVDRELEGGLVQRLALPTPALLTVQTGINEPRYATLRAIKQAADKPLSVLSLDDVNLNAGNVIAGAGARVVALSLPPTSGSAAEMLGDDADAVAVRILEIVRAAVGNGAAA